MIFDLKLNHLYVDGDWKQWTRIAQPSLDEILELITKKMNPSDRASLDGLQLECRDIEQPSTLRVSRYLDRFLVFWMPEGVGLYSKGPTVESSNDKAVFIDLGCGDEGTISTKYLVDEETMESAVTHFYSKGEPHHKWVNFEYDQTMHDEPLDSQIASSSQNTDDIPF